MAHFAQLDTENIVLRVLVVNDEWIIEDGKEVEQKGIDKLKSVYGQDTIWLQTSFNNRIRVRYAQKGYSYDATLDAFITPQPYPSWSLDTTTTEWVPPVPRPTDPPAGFDYMWVEEELSWVLVEVVLP